MTTAPAIEMRGITKSFPGVKALRGVNFIANAGEVHALAGENGAGKSTLMKILSGVYRPDDGTIHIEGRERHFTHPLDAIQSGIAVIYQEFSLLPERTVAQNIFLGREPTRYGIVDTKAMHDEARRVLSLFDGAHHVEPDTLISELDVASQQLVEIAKAVSLDARVIVMDEPTAALNEAECEVLFGLVDTLRKRGVAIIYITHRMREIARLANRVTVLKDGETAASFDDIPAPEAIVRAMVGRERHALWQRCRRTQPRRVGRQAHRRRQSLAHALSGAFAAPAAAHPRSRTRGIDQASDPRGDDPRRADGYAAGRAGEHRSGLKRGPRRL